MFCSLYLSNKFRFHITDVCFFLTVWSPGTWQESVLPILVPLRRRGEELWPKTLGMLFVVSGKGKLFAMSFLQFRSLPVLSNQIIHPCFNEHDLRQHRQLWCHIMFTSTLSPTQTFSADSVQSFVWSTQTRCQEYSNPSSRPGPTRFKY